MPQFEAPVGSANERNAGKIWPTGWWDATPFGEPYDVKPGKPAIHTGADLNCNGDNMARVYAMGDGKVIYAQRYPVQNVWGGLIIIYHGLVDNTHIYSRYGHVQGIAVKPNTNAVKGQEIARIGGADLGFDPHLHFDISITRKLSEDPGFWPGNNKALVEMHFVKPSVWLYRRTQKEAANKSAPTPVVNGPGTASSVTTELRYVIHPEGVQVRKTYSTSAEVVHVLNQGASLSLNTAGGFIQDGYMWGQIVGGEFNGNWVAVCKKDAKDLGDFYLSKQPPH